MHDVGVTRTWSCHQRGGNTPGDLLAEKFIRDLICRKVICLGESWLSVSPGKEFGESRFGGFQF